MPPFTRVPLQLPQVVMPQLRQQQVAMRRAQLLVCLLPALLMPPEWDAAICVQFAIARTGVLRQGCINNTPATITAGTDWDIIHSDSAGASLDAPPCIFKFNTGLEPDTIQSGMSRIIWTSCNNIDSFSGFMDEAEFTGFSGFISDPAPRSLPSVRDDPDMDQASLPTPPDGPGLGSDLGFDAADFLPLHSDVNAQSPDTLHHTDVPLANTDVNKALFEARLQCLDDSGINFPWETGVMGEIFNDADEIVSLTNQPAEYLGFSDQQHATVGPSESASASKQVLGRDLDLPFYSFAIRVRPNKDLFESREVLWKRAIDKWLQIFEVLVLPGQLGLAVDQELHFADELQHGTVLGDALGVKSPRTALKQAHTLLKYFNWLHDQQCAWFPWDRSNCLAYLGFADGHSPAATLGMAFLEALRFGRHVMQIPIPDVLRLGPQLKGRAQRLLLTKEGYHPALPLKAQGVATLEKMMLNKMDVVDKYMLGAVLFTIFSWSRWLDLQFINKFRVDRSEFNGQFFGFLETETAFHKTATSLKKKMRFMPVVCPIRGITDIDWTPIWLEIVSEFQVDMDARPFGPICRAPSTDGFLCKRSCTSDEISAFVNKVLGLADENRLSSHGFKHTTLSRASAYGIDETARTLLGHHELPGSKSMAVYSRDMLTCPLQVYCSMFSNIRGDHFRPDELCTSRVLDLPKIERADKVDHATELGVGAVPAPDRPGGVVDEEGVPTTPLDDTGSLGNDDKRQEQIRSDAESDSLASTDSRAHPTNLRTCRKSHLRRTSLRGQSWEIANRGLFISVRR